MFRCGRARVDDDVQMFRPGRLVGFAVLLFLVLAGGAQADTINVTRTDDPAGAGTCPDDCSLRQAINSASVNDTISLPSGKLVLTQGKPLVIARPLFIAGAGAKTTTIDAADNVDRSGSPTPVRAMVIAAGAVSISQLTFANGTDGEDEVTSTNPLAANGGGAIYDAEPNFQLTLQGVDFKNNYAPAIGGAISARGPVTV